MNDQCRCKPGTFENGWQENREGDCDIIAVFARWSASRVLGQQSS